PSGLIAMALTAPRPALISPAIVKPAAISSPETTSLTVVPASTCWSVVGGHRVSERLTSYAVESFRGSRSQIPTLVARAAPLRSESRGFNCFEIAHFYRLSPTSLG